MRARKKVVGGYGVVTHFQEDIVDVGVVLSRIGYQ